MKSRSQTRRRSVAQAPRGSPPRGREAASPPEPSAQRPGYDDLLAIVRLIESGSRFSEFRLRSGDIEVEIKRANGAEQVVPGALPEPQPTPAKTAPGVAAPEVPEGHHVIRSPMVGTFYRAPEPGAKPFVEVGTRVKPDSIVCIIEVMKLMNSVPAGVAGVVTHVFAENAHMVEFGQALVAIRAK